MTNSVTLPNGVVLDNIPDEIWNRPDRKDVITAKALASGLATLGDFNTTADDMSWHEKLLAGTGKGMTDIGRGIMQTAGMLDQTGLIKNFGPGSQQAIKEAQERDKSLMKTGWGKTGNVVGKVAAGAPAAFIPGANTALGASAIGAGLGLLEPVAEGNVLEEKAKNAAIGGAFGFAGNRVANGVGNFFQRRAANRAAQLASNQSRNATQDTTLAAGRELGYRVNPTQANPSIVNRTLEGMAGKISTAQRAAEGNQQVTNDIARRTLGIADDQPLSPELLEGVRRQAGQAYEAVKRSGREIVSDNQYIDDLVRIGEDDIQLMREFPQMANNMDEFVGGFLRDRISPPAAIETIKRLRSNASTLFRSDDPARVAQARASRQIADAIEGLVGRNLQQSGDDALFQNFQNARQLIAQTHTIEDAINPGTGNVIARKLAGELNKGKPLTGELRTAAQFSSAFPKATQEITSSMPGISPLDVYAAGGMSAATGNPSVLAAVMGRPAVRSLILSQPYQNAMTQPAYTNQIQQLMAALLNNPELKTLASQTPGLINANQ